MQQENISQIFDLATSKERVNHQIAIKLYQSGLFQVKELLDYARNVLISSKVKEICIFNKFYIESFFLDDLFKNSFLTRSEDGGVLILGKPCPIDIDDLLQFRKGYIFENGYSSVVDSKGFSDSDCQSLSDYMMKYEWPENFITRQSVSSILFFIKRRSKLKDKISINYPLVKRLQKILVSSNYKSLLFCFGLDFTREVYTYYQNSKWFEECAKIEQEIAFANNYFKPKVKLSL